MRLDLPAVPSLMLAILLSPATGWAGGPSAPVIVPMPQTGLNGWPGALAVDETRGRIYVGLSIASSVIYTTLDEIRDHAGDAEWFVTSHAH
jgi:hypothetical protein